MAVVTPSSLVIDTSASATSTVSLSVAELLPGFGSVPPKLIDAVLDSVPVADEKMVQFTV